MSKATRTFKLLDWNGKSISRLPYTPNRTTIKQTLASRDFTWKRKAVIVGGCVTPGNVCEANSGNSFVGAIREAFNNHLNLEMRPDDVWIAIGLVFSNYIAQYGPEDVGEQLGNLPKIVGVILDDVMGDNPDWYEIIKRYAGNLGEKSSGLLDWLKPTFSTTTRDDKMISRLLMMGSARRFVDFARHSCGIPQVSMHGTEADWEALLSKVDYIAEFGRKHSLPALVDWHLILVPILKQFLDSYRGIVDNDFWQSCVHRKPNCVVTIDGWILAFSPFEKKSWRLRPARDILIGGVYGSAIDKYTFQVNASIDVPLNLSEPGSSKPEYFLFYAGGIVSTFDEATHTIAPRYDWVVASIPEEVYKKFESERQPVGDQRNPVPLPEAQLADALEALSLEPKIRKPCHRHQLNFYKFNQYRENTCDLCKGGMQDHGYRCAPCDFAVCLTCS